MVMPEEPKKRIFLHEAECQNGNKFHVIAIDSDGDALSWGNSNSMGQLGREGKVSTPQRVSIPGNVKAFRAFVGGGVESGHSAILDTTQTKLFVAGCDRWQQLGLGSSSGGSSGYTWGDGGKIWRSEFVFNEHLHAFMRETSASNKIRDVSLGCDHTVVLSENQRDVYAFGKGGEGQLGVVGKPFVSAPIKSTRLSCRREESDDRPIAAVCAIQHCSLTLDEKGNVMKEAGKCRRTTTFMESLQKCIERARRDRLLIDATREVQHKGE